MFRKKISGFVISKFTTLRNIIVDFMYFERFVAILRWCTVLVKISI